MPSLCNDLFIPPLFSLPLSPFTILYNLPEYRPVSECTLTAMYLNAFSMSSRKKDASAYKDTTTGAGEKKQGGHEITRQ